MTGATADRFALPNRGYIKPGYFADLTIFDENEIRNSTEMHDTFGIKSVYVNGSLILDGDKIDTTVAKTTGKAIRVK